MTIPIVFAIGVDPVGGGLVASLNRPGANITGATYLLQDLIGKRMGLLHEIVPAAAMIGYLRDPSGPFPEAETKDAETAADRRRHPRRQNRNRNIGQLISMRLPIRWAGIDPSSI